MKQKGLSGTDSQEENGDGRELYRGNAQASQDCEEDREHRHDQKGRTDAELPRNTRFLAAW
jgi:hypothetical protein